MPELNYLAVLIAAVAAMALGFLWYSPALFAKQWMKLSGLSEAKFEDSKKKGMGKTYAISTLGSVLMAFVLAMVFQFVGTFATIDAIILAFWLWLGFVAPVMVNSVLFEGKSWNLFWINSGYQLASLILMALILSFLG